MIRSTVAVAAAVMALAACSPRPALVIVGDSTASPQPAELHPLTGWGVAFPCHAKPPLVVRNHAVGGQSSESYRATLWWEVRRRLGPGDTLLIEFGRNDQSKLPPRFATPQRYQQNLVAMVTEARAAGATPVILTPVARYVWRDGQPVDDLALYSAAARAAAQETGAPLIDVNALLRRHMGATGEQGAARYYVLTKRLRGGDQRPASDPDRTHLTVEGAALVATIVAQELAKIDAPSAGLVSAACKAA